MDKTNGFVDFNAGADEVVRALTRQASDVPKWDGPNGLKREYDPTLHPVMDRAIYQDVPNGDGTLEMVTRITYDLQRLAVKRMTEMCNGVPVKRIYSPEDDKQAQVAKYMERIFQRNRIDSFNTERDTMLFAGCEVMTLWSAVEERNTVYGFDSPLKFRCRNFSQMRGDMLFPLFDEYGDMVSMGVMYERDSEGGSVRYFDAYTADRHVKMKQGGNGWEFLEDDDTSAIGKIPCVYVKRDTPIWEDTSKMVYEMEWAMSRNGNYLRKNSKPLFVVYADEEIRYGGEGNADKEFRSILQYPSGSSAGYVTWPQAIDNLKFYVSELRSAFFTQLQLPDWNYEKMSQQALSGESRKQLFIDAQLKVKDESGRLLEMYDREVNVVKSLLKLALPEDMREAVDSLQVESVVTPFTIGDDKDTIDALITANGGKPIISQRESIERYGWSDDVDKTLSQIRDESLTSEMGF